MTVVRWRFDDPSTLESYTFSINPKEGGSPSYKKKFQYENTSAPDGKVLVFQGRDEPQKLTWDGTILDQALFDALVTWWDKRNQITVTDDLGRVFTIIIESFEPKRVRAATVPWKHTYSVTATIVNWA